LLIHHELPSNWELSNKGDQIRFTVPTDSTEYKSIIDQFNATMKPYSPIIVRLERIQNEPRYKQYKIHEEEFQKRLKKDTVRTLYHGCSEHSANAIIRDRFDRRYAGINGKYEIDGELISIVLCLKELFMDGACILLQMHIIVMLIQQGIQRENIVCLSLKS
jgi:hypothetical protein